MNITFGKYKGQDVDSLILKDPKYLIWAHNNVSYFSLTDEQLKMCKEKTKRVFVPYDESDEGSFGCGGFLEDDYYSESMFEGAFGFCD